MCTRIDGFSLILVASSEFSINSLHVMKAAFASENPVIDRFDEIHCEPELTMFVRCRVPVLNSAKIH
jgi:hypothetical protein